MNVRAPDCRCDHPARAHEHHTPCADCAVCGCPDYQPYGTDWARVVVYSGLALSLAAFWAGVWLGLGQPLLDAWRGR